MADKMKFDVRKHPPGHQFTVVQCEKCGAFYEPCGKEHNCKKERNNNGSRKM